MPGKFQTIRDFTSCRPSQICRYWSDLNRQKSVPDTPDIEFGGKEWKVRQKLKFVCCTPMYDRETGSQRFRGLVISEIHRRLLRRYKFQFSFVGNDRHRRNLGRVGKIETLPIFQICPRPSQTIGDIYDFEFSLVGKIWDSRETAKSPIVWDFPDIWKPGLNDICDFEFLVGKIWDSRETVKSPIVWDFPDIWKPGLGVTCRV